MFVLSLFKLVLQGIYVLFILFLFIYVYWPGVQLDFVFVSFYIHTTGSTSETRTANPSVTREFILGFVALM